jgi:prepilin-type N-terminal cleavage/methylation domain-containing protein
MRRSSLASRRTGFTLIELLVVVAIISMLMTLSVIAVHGVYRSVDNSRQQAEINNIANACEMFKSKYGHYPPSWIQLYNNQPAPAGYESTDSAKYLRAIFGSSFPVRNSHSWIQRGPGAGSARLLTLSGFECLVLFLGGPNGTGWGKDKSNPTNMSGPKEAPMYTFDQNRLAFTQQGGGVYLDRFGTPYAYYSGAVYFYVGGSWQPTDCQNVGSFPNAFYYAESNGVPVKFQSFQIISAGRDRQFGSSGQRVGTFVAGSLRAEEMDNFTNFHTGELRSLR